MVPSPEEETVKFSVFFPVRDFLNLALHEP